MFKRIWDGMQEGNRRYGSRHNANPKCARCGAGLGPDGALGFEHGGESYCADCALEKGFIDKKDLENSDRDQGDYAKCADCGHEKALHTEGGSKCYTCGCAEFKNTLKNAEPTQADVNARAKELRRKFPDDSAEMIMHELVVSFPGIGREMVRDAMDKIENAGPARCSCGGTIEPVAGQDDRFECDDCGQVYEKDDWRSDRYKAVNALKVEGVPGGKTVAFVDCETCDAGITEARIQEHLDDGHTVIKVMKNDAPPLPGADLGYDYGTSTTTVTPGTACKECGHPIGQKFYDVNCTCRCHNERANNLGPQGCPSCGSHQYEIAEGQDQVRCLDCGKVSDLTMWNTICDICRKEEGAGLEEHLSTRHGLEPDVAAVVAEDMERVRG